MNQWTTSNGELRAGVEASQARYMELRRRSEEARLIEAARGTRPSRLRQMIAWLRGERATTPQPLVCQPELEP